MTAAESRWAAAAGRCFASYALWRQLSRAPQHSVARHLRGKLRRRGTRAAVLPIALVAGALLLFAFVKGYSLIGAGVVWSLPLWLMLFSSVYVAVWMHRIITLAAGLRQVEVIGVIPRGRVFVGMTLCQVVLHEDESLGWLTVLRQVVAGLLSLGLLMALLVVLQQLGSADWRQLAVMLLELLALALIIYAEHTQSLVLGCLLALVMGRQRPGRIDATSAALLVYALLQIASYALALVPLLLMRWAGAVSLLVLFLLLREGLAGLLWRVLLHQANDSHEGPAAFNSLLMQRM